jgi:hypothetical protein
MRSERAWRPSGAAVQMRFLRRLAGKGHVRRAAPRLSATLVRVRRSTSLLVRSGARHSTYRVGPLRFQLAISLPGHSPRRDGERRPLRRAPRMLHRRERTLLIERVIRTSERREMHHLRAPTVMTTPRGSGPLSSRQQATGPPPIVHRKQRADSSPPRELGSLPSLPAAPAGSPPPPSSWLPAAPTLDLPQVTEHVMRALDKRLIAQRERRGGV